MKKTWIFVTILFFSFESTQFSEGSTGIFFQETDLILPQGTHNTKRKPISKPDICGDDELLYPGDLDDDWVCDCRPTYVYHPDHNRCFGLYRQGPCQQGEQLILKSGSKVPQCERNTCRRDNQVKFQGRCYVLGQRGPCTNIITADVVEVNETTLELGCVKTRRLPTQLNTRFTEILEINGCKKGSKKEHRICEKKNVQFWIAPELCGEDKALYKIPNEEERLCDCKSGFIYHPETKMCYQAHLRGPCDEGQIFVLENDTGVCIEGTCKGPNELLFNESCVEIGTTASCTDDAIVGVNADTFDVGCVAPLVDSKPGTVLPDLPNCPKGNKRDMNDQC